MRWFDPAIDAWHITYFEPTRPFALRQVGRAVGPDIVQTGDEVDGVTRRFVLRLAAQFQIAHHEAALRTEDFLAADEAFMCSTTRQIVPITACEGQGIGTGQPGPVTRRLHAAFIAPIAR